MDTFNAPTRDTSTVLNAPFADASVTWDQSTETWDQATGTWNHPVNYANPTKNTSTIINPTTN